MFQFFVCCSCEVTIAFAWSLCKIVLINLIKPHHDQLGQIIVLSDAIMKALAAFEDYLYQDLD